MKALSIRLAFFVVVGTAAAAVHFSVVVLLVSAFGWQPLVANVAGWLLAFVVSFAGHRLLTFRSRAAPPLRAMGRFFAVSAIGFGANELAYAAMLRLSALRYDVLLAIVLLLVAVMTYLLSSRWAFLGKGSR
jgi:putative flippase GtrA